MKKRAIVDSQYGIDELESLNSSLNISDLPYFFEHIPENWKELKEMALKLPNNKQGLLIKLIPADAICKQERLTIYRKSRREYSVATFWHNGFCFWTLQLNANIPEMWDVIKSIMKVGEK